MTPARDERRAQPELADAVRTAVLAIPGVADMHTGTFGEVATYLPGRRVDGVRIRPGGTEVHVVLIWGSPVLAVAADIRVAVEPLVGTSVDVSVEDVVPNQFRPGQASR